MKLILEIRAHGHDEQTVYLTLEKSPILIGRGFNNDLILNDPYVSPQHLQIEYDDKGFFVSDLDSENGFIVNEIPQNGQRVRLLSGDTLCLGQTEMRIYAPEHPVAAAVRLQKTNPFFLWLSRARNVWITFLLTLAFVLGWTYLEIWTEEIELILSSTVAATTGIIVLWASAWSVAGRLAGHKAHFRSHAAIACLYIIAGTLFWYVEVYVDFLTNENWAAILTTYGINFILLAFLIYGSGTLATRMIQRRRLILAVFFSIGVMGGFFALDLVSTKKFNQQPLYPSTLKPYLSRLAPTDTVEEFMVNNKEIFSSKEFNTSQKKS